MVEAELLGSSVAQAGVPVTGLNDEAAVAEALSHAGQHSMGSIGPQVFAGHGIQRFGVGPQHL
jgi:hypothetical protein